MVDRPPHELDHAPRGDGHHADIDFLYFVVRAVGLLTCHSWRDVIPGRREASSPEGRDELNKLDLPGLVLRTIPE